MKRSVRLITTLFCFMLLFGNLSVDAQNCILKGELIDCKSKSIILLKAGEDFRHAGIEIPVKKNRFEYELNMDQPEGYTLYLGKIRKTGSGRRMCLFLEPGEINITIHSEDEFDKNSVTGSKSNDEYTALEQQLDAIRAKGKLVSDSLNFLVENDRYFSDAMNALFKKLEKAKSQDEKNTLYREIDDMGNAGLDLTEEADKLRDKDFKNYQEMIDYQQEYIHTHPSLVSYFLLYEDLIYYEKRIDIAKARESYEALSKKYPSHPYNSPVKNLIVGIEQIKIGGKYVDFSAPDLDGKTVQLSEIIDGKVAIIDLWATWCGPCIAKSRKMVPIYEEFKDSGFTVVGVAGEFKNTDRLKKFFKKGQFPWTNLVDLDRENEIWEKYCVSNGGGGVFMVDQNGTIIAIDPTAEEVRAKLKALL